MEAVKCARGHYYDKALGKCPVCAAEGKRHAHIFVDYEWGIRQNTAPHAFPPYSHQERKDPLP